MATATQVVGRISGLVAFSDGSIGSFGANLDDGGRNSTNINSVNDYKQVYEDKLSVLTALFATKLGITISSPGAPSNSKTVSDMTMEISGRVAYSNGTHQDFGVQYVVKTGAVELIPGSAAVILAVGGVAALRTKLDSLLETVTGTGTVTVPT